jgi:hypothetical protein
MDQPIKPETIVRLASILDQTRLEQFIRVCENTRDSGNGYGQVEIVFSRYAAVEIRSNYTVKLRDPDNK